VKITEETVERKRYSDQKAKMGYYDDDGHYHSFRQGLHKLADKVKHPLGHGHHDHVDVEVRRESYSGPAPRSAPSASGSGSPYLPNTVTIPCHHIRLGDFLMLQGRPCQVIRISTSSATGQYRYLGVDLFTKQLHEESSFISNPAPSVVVQTMLGPVFKQYRVLDLQDGYVVAMTETGDVKQGLQIIDQSNLSGRLSRAFESGRGSLRVLVLNDNGQELAVDMKVIHGSRL
jgi:translation elongation factor P/translation initiation factor 5A